MANLNKKDFYKEVAEAVRVELEEQNDVLYLVFKITDEQFKQKIKKNWLEDIDLKIIGKKLHKFEEE